MKWIGCPQFHREIPNLRRHVANARHESQKTSRKAPPACHSSTALAMIDSNIFKQTAYICLPHPPTPSAKFQDRFGWIPKCVSGFVWALKKCQNDIHQHQGFWAHSGSAQMHGEQLQISTVALAKELGHAFAQILILG